MYPALAFTSICFAYLYLTPLSVYDSFFLLKTPEAQNPALYGRWGPRIPLSLIPVAAALLPKSGRVLLFAADRGDAFGGEGSNWHSTLTAIYDPAADTVTMTKTADIEHGMFCPGISLDVEGRPIVSGGMSDKRVSIYDEISETWSVMQNMTAGRGYHAHVTLSNGNIFTIGGSWSGGIGGDDVPSKGGEVFDSIHQIWKSLPGCPVEPMLTNDSRGAFCSDNHAWLFAWKNSSVFQAGPSSAMNWYGTFDLGSHYFAGYRGSDLDSMNGNAVMYDAVQGKILTLGGSTSYSDSYSTTAAHIITISDPYELVIVEKIRSMHYPRAYANSVVLPNGEVFINGGVSYAKQWADVNTSLIPEIWNPITQVFVKAAESPTPRNYHSTAILLPDATVLTGGGGLCWSNCGDSSINHLDVQVYYPPYLFDSRGEAHTGRPEIIEISNSTIHPGATLLITTNLPIVNFALIRYGSVTHSINTDQRRIALEGDPVKVGYLKKNHWHSHVVVPNDPGIIPPGYWMLFAITEQGVPSHAATIHVQMEHKLNLSSKPSSASIQEALPRPDQKAGEGSSGSLEVRRPHPRLFATKEQWALIETKTFTDPYMIRWDQTIAERAERWRAQSPTPYNLEGPLNGNGVLNTARRVQLYIKYWAYMYRTTQDDKWRDRIWEELVVASGNSTDYFGVAGDNWNSQQVQSSGPCIRKHLTNDMW